MYAKAPLPVERMVETCPLAGEAQDPSSSKGESSLCRQVTVCGEELALGCGYLQYLQHHWDVGTLLLHILSDISLL